MVAMAGLFLTGDATFASFGYATIIVVAVAMLGSLTVLPALLSKLGDRVDRLRVPLVRRRRRSSRRGCAPGAASSTPCCAGRSSLPHSPAACSIALAIPALQMHMATPGPDTFPQKLAVVKTYDRMQQEFPGTRCRPTSSSRRPT